MSTDFPVRTRKIRGSTRLRPYTQQDRRGWRSDPTLTDTSTDG